MINSVGIDASLGSVISPGIWNNRSSEPIASSTLRLTTRARMADTWIPSTRRLVRATSTLTTPSMASA